MRRSVLTLLAALTLALGFALPAAQAQDAGAPVVGGGSFNSAPLLEPGRYHDTILPGEYLYYGFRMAAGQRLHITLTPPDIEVLSARRLGLIWLSGNIHTPTRTIDDDINHPGDRPYVSWGPPIELLVVSSDVVSPEQDRSDNGPWAGAGVYYLAVHAVIGRGIRDPPRTELAITMDAEVEGAAQPNATPTPTDTPAATADATARPKPTAEPEADDEPKPVFAAIGGVGGILIGVIAGIVLRQRRR
jgi:Ca-activated chloride channel family protein